MTDLPVVIVVLTLVIGVPLNVYITLKLYRLSRLAPQLGVLRERLAIAAVVLAAVIAFGLITLLSDLMLLSALHRQLSVRSLILALAIAPALYWLRLYRGARS